MINEFFSFPKEEEMAAATSSSSFKRKLAAVYVSSSSSDDDQDDESEEEEESESEEEFEFESGSDGESESENETDEDDPASESGSGSSSSDDDGDYDDGDDDDGNSVNDDDGHGDDDSKGMPSDEEHCNKVINLLRGRKSLNVLKLEDCKAYLRKHELRISGSKATCIKRILEHWRIKDGNGAKLYPESSFVINCTGDVCRGDVVLFKQRVYKKFDIVKRGGGANILGKRVVAGRVVNESYGSGKQQHTFSIEVLWSKGVKALPPLFPMLVKGRNLYRMKTFRQPWSNEEKRSQVLAEKHRRGAAARHVRAIAKAKAPYKGSKCKKKSSTTRAPPNKKRKKETERAAEKKKENCAKLPSNGSKRKKKSPTTVEPPINRMKKGLECAAENMKRDGKRKVAQTTKSASSSATNHQAKSREVAKTRNSEPSAAHYEQSSCHPNGYQREYPYSQRHLNNNFSRPPVEVLGRNYMGVPQAYPGMHRIPSYNTGYSSSVAVASHGHTQHSYSTGYTASVHNQIPNRASYVGHAYGNPAFQLQPRRLDDGASGGQFHGWRRP